jgi:hypothetical protein
MLAMLSAESASAPGNRLSAVKSVPVLSSHLSLFLNPEAFSLLESNLKCDFTLIVTLWGTSCGLYTDKYQYLSVQKFLQLQPLLDVHVLFVVPEEQHHTGCPPALYEN